MLPPLCPGPQAALLRDDSAPSSGWREPWAGGSSLSPPLSAIRRLGFLMAVEELRSAGSHIPGQLDGLSGFSAKAGTRYLWGQSCLGFLF